MRSTPGLDGLRAIAIAAVVLGHAGVAALPGGELGIDVLLVVSGYVVTRFLLERYAEQRRADVDAPRAVRGSRAFQTLHVRRARRLLPALVLLLAVCLTTTALFVRDQLEVVRTDALGALAFVQNWQLVAQHRDPAAEPSVLSHLWVLAIEAQLVLGWSVVVLVVLWRVGLGGAGGPRLRALAVGGALASCALMWVLAVLRDVPAGADPSRLLLGTDTRASGFLLGAAAALVWSRQRLARMRLPGQAGALDVLGVAGLVVVGWFLLQVDERSPLLYRGGLLLLAGATVLVLVAAAHPRTAVGRVLSVPLLRGLGRRTYGLFVWHWPVVVLVQPEHGVPWSGAALLWLQLGLVLALTEVSYRLVEVPLRRGRSAVEEAADAGVPGVRSARGAVLGTAREWRRAVTAVSTAVVVTGLVGLTTGAAGAGAAVAGDAVPMPEAAAAATAVGLPPAATGLPPEIVTVVPAQPQTATETPGPAAPTPDASTSTSAAPAAEPAPVETSEPAPAPPAAAPSAAPAGTDCAAVACVAITYDDGPMPSTLDLVRLLQDRGAPATFFMLGIQVRAQPDAARAVADAGFEVASHGRSHSRLTLLDEGAVAEELTSATDVIERVTGKRPTLFRPPYGATDGRVAAVAASLGQAQVLWDVDTHDWSDKDPALVAQRAVSAATAGSIILMHDIHPTTVAATGAVIDGLRAKGLTLVTVSELLGGAPTPGASYQRRP